MQPVACMEHKNMLTMLFSGSCGACRLAGENLSTPTCAIALDSTGAEEDRLSQYSFRTET